MPKLSPRRLPLLILVGVVLLASLAYLFLSRTADTPGVRFTDVTESAGLRFRHTSGATGRKLLPETMGSGVVVLDFDGDGRPDLFFVNSCYWPGFEKDGSPPHSVLYRNKGDGTFEDVSISSGLAVELYGMGATAGDYDNDGFPDLFVTAVGGCKLFHNEAEPNGRRFVDVTATAGVGGPGGWPAVTGAEFLKWNKDVAFPSSAAWVDYDGDGRLDLFVCYYVTWSPAEDLQTNAVLTNGVRAYVPPTQFRGTQCKLWRNAGGGRFEDVSAAAGVEVTEAQRPVGKSLGVVVCDLDRDGWPDLVVANDTVRNFFFHNRPGPNGGRVFVESGLATGLAYADGRPRGGMGIDFAEIRPDKPAVVVANFTNEPNSLMVRASSRSLLFTDQALDEGLAAPSRGPMKFGAIFLDYDLDGWPDLLTSNGHLEPDLNRVQPNQSHAQAVQLFRNQGYAASALFREVTAADVGKDLFHPIVGRGCAYLDYDGNGTPDVVVTANGGPARLFRADNRLNHHWVRLALQGDGVRSNRDAIGAEVEVEAGGRVRRFYVSGSRGYLSQSELPVTVGLGSGTVVDRVTVRWPGRQAKEQSWTNLAVDTRVVLRQE